MQTVIACPWFENLEHFSMEILVEADKVASMGYMLLDTDGNDIPVYILATEANKTKLLDCYKDAFEYHPNPERTKQLKEIFPGGDWDNEGPSITDLGMPLVEIDGKQYLKSDDAWCWKR